MNRKELPTKVWYRLLQVTYGVICLAIFGTLALLAYIDLPHLEEAHLIVCEKTGQMFYIGSFKGYVFASDASQARSYCSEKVGSGDYRLETGKQLSQSWSTYLREWGMVFLIALLILFGIRR